MPRTPMSLEELRTLELPVTLECDDGYFTIGMRKIEIISIGESKLFIRNLHGDELIRPMSLLKHYPSQKPEKRTVVFRQWMDTHGFIYTFVLSEKGYYIGGDKCRTFDNDFTKWVGEEHHIEVPSDWRGEK